MSWSTIRRATDTDNANLEQAAERFCRRHGIEIYECSAQLAIDCALNPGGGCGYAAEDRARHLRPLWRRIVRRVLGSPNADGVAYGYVGFHVS